MFCVYNALLLLLFPFLSLCINPGLKGRITEKGYALGIEVLKAMLRDMHFPDWNARFNIGDFTLDGKVAGMHVSHSNFPQSSRDLRAGSGIQLSIRNADLTVSGQWRLNIILGEEHGSFDVLVSGLSISTVIHFTRDSTGRPAIQSTGCSTVIRDIDIRLLGGASFLGAEIRSFLQNHIQNMLNNNLCPEVNKAIERLNTNLKTMQISSQIDQFVELEYSLVDSPVTSQEYLDLNFKGSFYSIKNRTEPPFSPDRFTLPDGCNQMSQMLCIGVSEFFFNSAGFAYFTAGALSMDITDDMVPQQSPVRLTTDILGVIIPEITDRYPRMPMEMHLSLYEPPRFTYELDELTLVASGSLQAFALLPNSSKARLLQMRIEVSFGIQLSVSGVQIRGSLTDTNIHFILTDIYIGPYQCNRILWETGPGRQRMNYCTPDGNRNTNSATNQVKLTSRCELRPNRQLTIVTKLMTHAVNQVLLPMVNERLNEGFPLPVIDNIKFVNPSVKVHQGLLLISTDVQFLS